MYTTNQDVLEPQAHGGALKRGGQHAGIPGIGGPKAEIRHALLQRVSSALDRIEKMIDGTETVDSSIFLKAVEICARYGVGTQDEKIYLDNTLTPQALARVLAKHEGETLDQAVAFAISRDFAKELNLE